MATLNQFLEKALKTPINEQLSGEWDNQHYGRENVVDKIKDVPEKYDELFADCKQYVKDIDKALDSHKKKFGKDWMNWSHGGDLGRVHYDLQTIINWLNGGK